MKLLTNETRNSISKEQLLQMFHQVCLLLLLLFLNCQRHVSVTKNIFYFIKIKIKKKIIELNQLKSLSIKQLKLYSLQWLNVLFIVTPSKLFITEFWIILDDLNKFVTGIILSFNEGFN